MKRFHLIAGLLLAIIFLLTGQYMDRFHSHLQGMADGPRMLYRSRHIYILLSALLHLGIGTYFKYQLETWRRILQLVGSLLISVASVLFIIAFFYEPTLTNLYTPVSRKGIFISVAGVLLHLLSGTKSTERIKP
jgi:hypothetical protein